MVKHVILWTLKDEITAEEKEIIKQGIKEGLEGLKGKVPGIADIKVNINGYPVKKSIEGGSRSEKEKVR